MKYTPEFKSKQKELLLKLVCFILVIVLSISLLGLFYAVHQRYSGMKRLKNFAIVQQEDKKLLETFVMMSARHYYIGRLDDEEISSLLNNFGPTALYRIDKAWKAAGN